MANGEHLEILGQGIKEWNQWRDSNPELIPDLRKANLTWKNLSEFNLQRANLNGAQLLRANLAGADFREAQVRVSNLYAANLSQVQFQKSDLQMAHLDCANLEYANFGQATMGGTMLGNIDLSKAEGLDDVRHLSPSTIGVDTLYKSRGAIPEAFLRGCGVPDNLIASIPGLVGADPPNRFNSCFISYSSKDEVFAMRLHSRMRDEHLRVWFAPESVRGGQKLHEQIDRAIQFHDRLLLVLSQNSLHSEWVMTELRKARKAEIKENRRKLFPIRLVDYDTIRIWECFDADHGKDLAIEVREYYIPDFSNWKDHDSFERAFARLMRDLRAEVV